MRFSKKIENRFSSERVLRQRQPNLKLISSNNDSGGYKRLLLVVFRSYGFRFEILGAPPNATTTNRNVSTPTPDSGTLSIISSVNAYIVVSLELVPDLTAIWLQQQQIYRPDKIYYTVILQSASSQSHHLTIGVPE